MKNFMKDETAIYNPIISCLLSLAIVVIMYYLFMPLLWYISNTMIFMGAPAAPTLFYMKMARWGFYIFAFTSFAILVGKIYKKTHDSGRIYE